MELRNNISISRNHFLLRFYSFEDYFIKQLVVDKIAVASNLKYSFDFTFSNGHCIVNVYTNSVRQLMKIVK